MSLLPFILSENLYDPWESNRARHSGNDWNHFGVGITPHELQIMSTLPSILNSRKRNCKGLRDENAKVQIGKDGYQVLMDVQQFKPNEISVKTVHNTVVIEGKHEDRQDDHGFISRQFVRKYTLPKGYDAKEVISTLSSDGVLTIKAPPPQQAIQGNERVIQIQQTGPAHQNVKDVETDKEKMNVDVQNHRN